MAGKGIFKGKIEKDPKELTPLAVDQRVNKAFIDPGQAGQASVLVSSGESASGLHMRLVEQDLDVSAAAIPDVASGEKYLTQDEALFAYHAGLAAAIATDAPSVNAMNLRRIEGDLDTSGSAFEDGASVNETNMRRIEGDLDVGSGGTQVPTGAETGDYLTE